MSTKINVITPSNLGKTIELGALDSKKWDVKYDPDHFEFVEGKGLHLKSSVLQPLKDADVASGALVGSNLELTKNDGTKINVPMAGLIPAAKADHFLKAVEYKAAEKKIKFTVGNDLNAEESSYEIDVADLLPVVAGNGLQGNGTTASPLSIKTPANSGLKVDVNGIAFDKDALTELVDGTGEVSLGYIIPKA
jgi:hypothetical protein